MRSTYNAQGNWRRYPDGLFYNRKIRGPEIDAATVFDECWIECAPDGHVVGDVNLYNAGTKVTQVPGWQVTGVGSNPSPYRYDRNDPEVLIVRNAIRAGTCTVKYESFETDPHPIYTRDQLHENSWLTDLMHPFQDDDRDLFMEHLTEDLHYHAAVGDAPQRFTFPGIIEGANRTYYKRDEDAAAPAVIALSGLADAGWTPDIPIGPHALHAVDVLDTPVSVAVGDKRRVYHRRKSLADDIATIARAWNRYWRGLSDSVQSSSAGAITARHFEHAIGRAWADKPYSGRLPIIYKGESTSERRDARDGEDWMLGNLEQWVEWGFADFVTAMGNATKRTILDSELDDYTFCHVEQDGDIADKLSNGGSGLLQATWDAYQATDYVAATRHGLSPVTASAPPVSVTQGVTTLANISVSGGLEPYEFAKVTTESWWSVDDAGDVTFTPDTTVTPGDYTIRVSVSDGIFDPVTVDIVVTVAAPAGD